MLGAGRRELRLDWNACFVGAFGSGWPRYAKDAKLIVEKSCVYLNTGLGTNPCCDAEGGKVLSKSMISGDDARAWRVEGSYARAVNKGAQKYEEDIWGGPSISKRHGIH